MTNPFGGFAQNQAPQAPQGGFQAPQSGFQAPQPQAQNQPPQAPQQVQGQPGLDQYDYHPPAPQNQATQAPQAGAFAAPGGGPAGNLSDLFAGGNLGGGDGSKIQDDLDALLLIRPLEVIEEMQTSMGPRTVVRADWVPLDGLNQGQVREGGLIFAKVLVSGINAAMQQGYKFVVGRLSQGVAKKAGHRPPYILLDPSQEDVAAAQAMAQNLGWV